MKKFFYSTIILITSFLGIISANAFSFTEKAEDVYICADGECGFQEGIDLIKDSGIDGLETDSTASQFIQDIVIYLLGFISLIAIIYVMYAGFRILTSSGDEEVLKKSKTTILYVIIGILVIWFAWAITIFALSIGSAGGDNNSSNTSNSVTCNQIYTKIECEASTLGFCNWSNGVCSN